MTTQQRVSLKTIRIRTPHLVKARWRNPAYREAFEWFQVNPKATLKELISRFGHEFGWEAYRLNQLNKEKPANGSELQERKRVGELTRSGQTPGSS